MLVKEAVGRTGDFSSNIVSALHRGADGSPVPHAVAGYRDAIQVLPTADPPDHTRHRRLVQPHLSPAALVDLEQAVEAIVDEHLEGVLDARRLDLVAAFTDPVPARTVCELLGLPPSDAPSVVELTLRTGALLDGVTDDAGVDRARSAAMELGLFTHRRLQEALREPTGRRPGLIGSLADLLEAGELTEIEVLSMLTVFVSAGSETTASLLATAIEALARDAALQERLRHEPAGIPDAVETMLREDGPFQFHYRYTPTDTSIGGVDIPAGSRVLLMWAAANRPAATAPGDEPTKLPPHFAFGRGIHFCIGAPVARLEARITLTRLLAATSSITLDPDRPPTRRPSIFIRRHATLPVVVEPTPTRPR
jgi:cytochrome P450